MRKNKKGNYSEESFTFGEQLKCIPGTGSVVTYIVIHRYRYSVPTMQKNLLLIIDLEKGTNRADTQSWNSAGSLKFSVLQQYNTPPNNLRDCYQNAETIAKSRLRWSFWEWYCVFLFVCFTLTLRSREFKHSPLLLMGLPEAWNTSWHSTDGQGGFKLMGQSWVRVCG